MLTLDIVKSKSAKRLEGLHPVVKKNAEILIEKAFNSGIQIIIVQGLRTIEEQNALYAQGRTTKGQIVTNAKGGQSYHNFGVAIDYAFLSDDGNNVLWTVNDKWLKVAQIGKSLGFDWGGDWHSFKDYPHLEMPFGISLAEYRAGKRPPNPKIELVESPLEDEENMAMKLEAYQWDLIVSTFSKYKDNGTLTSDDWLNKAKNKTLTASELAFLNLVIESRRS
jgi:peptidoglycan L-alanyl-D-glutamate endopeptidase CwlK